MLIRPLSGRHYHGPQEMLRPALRPTQVVDEIDGMKPVVDNKDNALEALPAFDLVGPSMRNGCESCDS
jgi:hypothetical protein